ncbi:hypothetical protein LCGC14_1355090, partial [marine sediment metagenome]
LAYARKLWGRNLREIIIYPLDDEKRRLKPAATIIWYEIAQFRFKSKENNELSIL